MPAAVTRRLAAIASGSSGDHACHAPTSAAARSAGQRRRNAVLGGASTVSKASDVTAPKRPPPDPRSAQKSVRVLRVRAGDELPVGQHDLGAAQRVAGQAVRPPEDAQPAAERQAGGADRRPAPSRDRAAVRRERLVHVAERRAGADGDRRAVQGDGPQGRQVDQQPLGRRAAGEAVPAAAQREREAVALRERERRGDVRGLGAARDGGRPRRGEARDGGRARGLVAGGCGQDQRARHRPRQRVPVHPPHRGKRYRVTPSHKVAG